MNNTIFVLLIIVISLILIRRLNNSRKSKVKSRRLRPDIGLWMEMTRQERKDLDEKDKKKSLERRTSLLNQIRKEYVDLGGRNQKE